MKGDFRRRIPVQTIETRFPHFKVLGFGAFGVVGKCGNYALKLQELEDTSKNEIQVLKKLNSLSDMTSIFTKAHEFMVCSDIPWSKELLRDAPHHCLHESEGPFLIIVMDYNPYMFTPSMLTESELRNHLRMLIEGIMIARKKFGIFGLCDLRDANWMMTMDKKPKLIDFGLSSTSKDILEDEEWFNHFRIDGESYKPKNDFIRMESILKEFGIKHIPDLTSAKEATADDWKVLKELLKQNYFKK